MRRRLRALLLDDLIRTSGWLFAAFAVSSASNYVFQVVIGRMLSPQEYGFLNSLLALLVVLGVPLTTLMMVVARRVAEYDAKGDFARVRSLFRLAHRRVLSAGLVGLAAFVLGARLLADYFHSPSVVPILLLGLCAYAALLVPTNLAVLQGLQDYLWLGIGSGLAGPVKLAFCVALVAAGFGVDGVLGGTALASAALFLTTYAPIRRHLAGAASEKRHVHQLSFAHLLPVFTANLAFAVLTQADMILVGRYFPAREAGMYASAAILGRSVMYVPGALVQAMFPMVSEHRAGRRDTRHLLVKSLAATLAVSGFGAALFFLFPEWIIRVSFGARYLAAAGVLRYFGLAMLPMALILVVMNYSIARGESFFSYVLAAGAVLEVVGITLFHRSLLSVVFVIMLVSALLVVPGLVGRGKERLAPPEAPC